MLSILMKFVNKRIHLVRWEVVWVKGEVFILRKIRVQNRNKLFEIIYLGAHMIHVVNICPHGIQGNLYSVTN